MKTGQNKKERTENSVRQQGCGIKDMSLTLPCESQLDKLCLEYNLFFENCKERRSTSFVEWLSAAYFFHPGAEYERNQMRGDCYMLMDRIALVLAIIGGINWGSVGLFRFDLVAWLFGGQTATVSRVVYTLVGLAALWCVSLLFRTDAVTDEGI